MPVLIGGIPGQQSRMTGGISGIGPEMLADVQPMVIRQATSKLRNVKPPPVVVMYLLSA